MGLQLHYNSWVFIYTALVLSCIVTAQCLSLKIVLKVSEWVSKYVSKWVSVSVATVYIRGFGGWGLGLILRVDHTMGYLLRVGQLTPQKYKLSAPVKSSWGQVNFLIAIAIVIVIVALVQIKLYQVQVQVQALIVVTSEGVKISACDSSPVTLLVLSRMHLRAGHPCTISSSPNSGFLQKCL